MTGGDSDTGNPSQPYQDSRHRQLSEQGEDRPRTSHHAHLVPRSGAMIDLSQFKIWTEEEFERAFRHPLCRRRPNGGGAEHREQERELARPDDIDESALPDDLMELIRDGVPQARATARGCSWARAGSRSSASRRERLPAFRPLSRRDRREVHRSPGTVCGARSSAPTTRSRPKGRVRRLRYVRAHFACAWFSPSFVIVCVLAADRRACGLQEVAGREVRHRHSRRRGERRGGREAGRRSPVAHGVSGSGNAKTETVRSLSGAGAHVTSTIASEGALLSATARSQGATGGLLHKIGSRGLLVIKDFTSILAVDRNVAQHRVGGVARGS